ncbi:MAG TPA: DUF5916 domain-containing protein [SAR86 cluster bacterium]|nr:DUF5916 domain-containing protein [SAR86 cluster bacterium]|tara:strand:- start:332 stop:2620 length:2289 start_codon:yes stop_codon:yes gene_type:complete
MKKSLGFILIQCLSFMGTALQAEIIIDGKLDEDEWNEARQITTFYEVFPYTLNPVTDIKTVILIQESEEGIFFGFKNYQSNESMRSQSHQRDDERSIADKNGVTIDFDADALTGYQFFVSSSSSIGDATYRNENDRSYDWDADWLSAISVEEGVWYSEMFIPWTVAPMKAQSGNKRKVRMAFYRMLAGPQKVLATIQGSSHQNIYLSVFNEYTFNNYQTSGIDFFPYLTVNEDRIKGEIDNKVGAEVFWKIDSSKQLNAAFNPDFGQVESDEVVVNFSATETFYSDKRPFFSENHGLFNVTGWRFLYIINTRRIGGEPDYDCSKFQDVLNDYCLNQQVGANDIDYAVRYSQQSESLDFGFLGASEANENFSTGKDFYSVRLRTRKDDLTIGYLGTYVDRPVIDRTAQVNSVDFDYRPSSVLRINGLLVNSKVADVNGYGFDLGLGYDPNKTRHFGFGLYYFDENLDVNDMGYLVRNDWLMFGGRYQIKKTDFNTDSLFRERQYELGWSLKSDSSLDKEPSSINFSIDNSFKNSSQFKFGTFYRTNGRENRITRDSPEAPYINMPEGYGVEMDFNGPRDNFLRYSFDVKREKGSYSPELGWKSSYKGSISISPIDTLIAKLSYRHTEESEWLNWISDNLLATYDKKQRSTTASIQWFEGTKHELRVKAQMVAFTARDPKPYLGDINGNLNPFETSLPSITVSQLAFQVRYRYEIQPLAYLYVVYTKGGKVAMYDEEDSLNELYMRPWKDPQSDNFTVKLRYRF